MAWTVDSLWTVAGRGLRVAIRVYSRFWCAAATSADYSMANRMDDGKILLLGPGWRRGGSGWVDVCGWMGEKARRLVHARPKSNQTLPGQGLGAAPE
jgi:hypothetical protein